MVYSGPNYVGQIVSLRLPVRDRLGDGMTEKVVWHVIKIHAKKLEMPKLAPHDPHSAFAGYIPRLSGYMVNGLAGV